MVAVTPPRPLADEDDRNLFDCGRESLKIWFRRHAWANQASGASRVNVIADATSGRIVGYVTLSAAQIECAFLPKAQQRNRPVSLLLFALKTTLRAAEVVGSIGVITHPLDDSVRRFYARWGFQDLPFDPRRAMLVRMVRFAAEFCKRGN
jgi:hypothetical protein